MGYPVKVVAVRDAGGSAGFNIVVKTLTVEGVNRNSVAYRNGLRAGAVVKAINGTPIHNWDNYTELAVGQPKFEMTLHFPSMPVWHSALEQAKAFASRTHDVVVERSETGDAGFSVMTADLVSTQVDEKSAAYANGLRDGEQLLAVDGTPISDMDGYKKLAIGKSPFTVTVLRPAAAQQGQQAATSSQEPVPN